MVDAVTVRTNGKAEMAYVGERPWHGLGEQLPEGQSIETWMKAAGMDWEIKRTRVRYPVSATEMRTMDDKHVMIRSDTKDALSVVSDKFKLVQPREVLEFFRDLTEAAGFQLETAGTLFGGRRFWALASTGESAKVVDVNDRIRGFLLLSTSCDGSLATEGRYTNVRVVCNNTLSMARAVAPKFRVTHRSVFSPSDAKNELGVVRAHEAFAETMGQFRLLATAKMSKQAMVKQTLELLKPGIIDRNDADEIENAVQSRVVLEINNRAVNATAIGSAFDGANGTQWAWLNSVTEYVDHVARARNVNNRLNSAWFGPGSDLKDRAFEMALSAI